MPFPAKDVDPEYTSLNVSFTPISDSASASGDPNLGQDRRLQEKASGGKKYVPLWLHVEYTQKSFVEPTEPFEKSAKGRRQWTRAPS